jgi:ABC-type Na+ efflux pump permease subunit
MAKVTITFGVTLVVLGAISFFGTGSTHPTALIPAYFGIGLMLCGFLANSPSDKRRMIIMHLAVTIGLLGFLGSAIMAILESARAHGGPLAHPAAVESQTCMAVICLIYVGVCIRSFIAARRSRRAAV